MAIVLVETERLYPETKVLVETERLYDEANGYSTSGDRKALP